MAKSRKNTARGLDFTRTYDLYGIGGDLSELVNMYVDHDSEYGGIETVPGFRQIASLGAEIHGLYRQKLDTGVDYLIIHAGRGLYRKEVGKDDELEEITTLSSNASTGFTLGDSLYIIDGDKILELRSDGSVNNVATDPYIPTTYKNGLFYEERNLLTKNSYQEYEVATAEEFAYGSPHLLYSITSRVGRECAVSGVDKTKTEALFVPSYKYIGGVRYAVTEILPYALEGSLATELTVSEGVIKIGDNAVRGCKNLRRAILPTSLEEIGKYAFASEASLNYVRLGLGLSKIGAGVFANCPELSSVAYEGDSAQLEAIEGSASFSTKTIVYNVTYTTVTAAFSTHGYGFRPTQVYIDGVSQPFTLSGSNEVRIELDYKSDLEGKLVRIYGVEMVEAGMQGELGGDLVALYKNKISPETAIFGCTLSTVFDGRVFLSGNPALPGVVFYSSETRDGEITPRYFGSYDFISTGSSYPVSSILSTGDSLIVTKSGESGEGSVLYYGRGKSIISPRSTRYERTRSYGVDGGVAHACALFGEPLFVSGDRLYKSGASKSLVCVSEQLGAELQSSESIFSVEWQGYLFLSLGKKVILVEKRSTDGGYRLYPLSDIGSWKNSTPVYVYADIAHPELAVSEKRGEVAYGRVMSRTTEYGEVLYYVIDDGIEVAVMPTEELSGGIFNPASHAVSIGKRLYFGTGSGDVYLFNNDLRGVAPERIREGYGFDEEAYKAAMGDKIHPDFYDFAGHRISYSLAVEDDYCDDITGYKLTSPFGTVITVSADGTAAASYTAVRDGEPSERILLVTGTFDFSLLDFSLLSLASDGSEAYILPEERVPWIKHGVHLDSEQHRSPLKIKALSLCYKTAGNIKR